MPFFLIGILLVVIGWHFRSKAIKGHDHEGIIGATALVEGCPLVTADESIRRAKVVKTIW